MPSKPRIENQGIERDRGTVNVRGVEHYYEWIGKPETANAKPTLVFLHGWCGSARYWRSTAASLCEHFNCLLYDLRGFGCSSIPPQNSTENLGYELEEYAVDLAVLLDQLKLDRVSLNAHSMGASIALFFANLYPEKVERAILTCNGIFEYDKKAFEAFYKFGKYVVQFRYSWFLSVPFADRAFMARFLHRPIPGNERRAFLEDFLRADYEAALGTIYTSVSKKAVEVIPQEFARLQVPTLLIAGEKDKIIPAEMGRQAAALSERVEYCEIPKTAHFPMLEDPQTYLACASKFLGLTRSPTPS